MAQRTRIDEPPSDIARARARYEMSRTVLVALLVVIMLTSLALVSWQGMTIRDSQRQIEQLVQENHDQTQRQNASEQARREELDAAVAVLTAEQRRALVAHDHSVREYLGEALRLLDREVNAPANQERIAPLVLPPTQPRQPLVGPTVKPAPKSAPPCEKAGRSGRCKK